MADMSYLSVIERYHEYRDPIRELLASIITGVAEAKLLHDQEAQREALLSVRERYPFVQILLGLFLLMALFCGPLFNSCRSV